MKTLNFSFGEVDSTDSISQASNIPSVVDLRQWDSPVEDQGNLGSCAAHAITSAYEILLKKQFPEQYTELSRLFVYYNSRLLEESISEDSGVMRIRDSMKALKLVGVCKESLWNYDESKFSQRPSNECYVDAITRRISSYKSVSNINSMMQALSNGKPIVIGIDTFQNFPYITKDDPVLTMPIEVANMSGGHSMVIVGYSKPDERFLAKNSFGVNWGDNGYVWIPFDYIQSNIFECWTFDILLSL